MAPTLPGNSTLKTLTVTPNLFELDFKSSTWQNRPARVYMRLNSDDVDLSVLEEDATSRFLVLSERTSTQPTLLKLTTGHSATSFYYQGTSSQRPESLTTRPKLRRSFTVPLSPLLACRSTESPTLLLTPFLSGT